MRFSNEGPKLHGAYYTRYLKLDTSITSCIKNQRKVGRVSSCHFLKLQIFFKKKTAEPCKFWVIFTLKVVLTGSLCFFSVVVFLIIIFSSNCGSCAQSLCCRRRHWRNKNSYETNRRYQPAIVCQLRDHLSCRGGRYDRNWTMQNWFYDWKILINPSFRASPSLPMDSSVDTFTWLTWQS